MVSAVAAIDARIWQAVLAGGFVALGWVVNGWRVRRDAGRLRAERLRDVHRALYAEIGTNLANLWDEARIDAWADGIVAQMESEGDSFVPFIPREHNDFVFDQVIGEIYVLPRQTIDPVVTYYTTIKAVAAMADDMRGEGFKALPTARRVLMYRDYIAMKKQALQFGGYANSLIAAYAEGGAAQAEHEARRLSSRAGDPSGQ